MCVYLQCHKIIDYAVDKLKFKLEFKHKLRGCFFFVSHEITFENTNFNIISINVTKTKIMCLTLSMSLRIFVNPGCVIIHLPKFYL